MGPPPKKKPAAAGGNKGPAAAAGGRNKGPAASAGGRNKGKGPAASAGAHKGGASAAGGKRKRTASGSEGSSSKPHPAAPGNGKTVSIKGEQPAKKQKVAVAPKPKKILSKAEAKLDRREKKRSKQSDAVQEANQLSQIPVKQIPASERQTKIGSILERIRGDYAELATRRDTTRVLQNMVKYGGVQHKTKIVEGLKGKITRLALHRHGVWLLLKILQHGKDSFTQTIAEELFPELIRVAFHSTGAQVVDYLFMMDGQDRGVTLRRRVNMLLYFLHAEYRVFDSNLGRFKQDVLEAAQHDIVGFAVQHLNGDRAELTENLTQHLQRVVGKQQLMFRFNHSLLGSWMRAADRETTQFKELSAELHNHILALRNTAAGVSVACELIRIADAKGRKHVIKGLGEELTSLAMDFFSWKILAGVLHYTDDTVLLRKKVLKSLEVMDVVTSKQGCLLFLWILSAGRLGFFTQQEVEIILGEIPVKPADKNEDKEKIRLALVAANLGKFSKKDYESRRAELLDEVLGKLLAAFGNPQLVEIALSDKGAPADLLCEVVAEAQTRLAQPALPAAQAEVVRGSLQTILDVVASRCNLSVRQTYLGEAMEDDVDVEEEKEKAGAGADDSDSDDHSEDGGDDDDEGDDEKDEGKFVPQKFEPVKHRLLQNALKNKQHAAAAAAAEKEKGCVLDTLSHFTVKRLLSALRSPAQPELTERFVGSLWERSYALAPEALLKSSRACFVLREALDLLADGAKAHKGLAAQLKKLLAAIRGHQKLLAAQERPGCKVLLEFLQKHK